VHDDRYGKITEKTESLDNDLLFSLRLPAVPGVGVDEVSGKGEEEESGRRERVSQRDRCLCIHTYTHTSIHPYIHTYIHT